MATSPSQSVFPDVVEDLHLGDDAPCVDDEVARAWAGGDVIKRFGALASWASSSMSRSPTRRNASTLFRSPWCGAGWRGCGRRPLQTEGLGDVVVAASTVALDLVAHNQVHLLREKDRVVMPASAQSLATVKPSMWAA